MVSYSDGKIYKITSPQTDEVYVGSTAEKRLCVRMVHHRSQYRRYLEGKSNYVASFALLKYDGAVITLIESYPCKTKEELRARERYWYERIDNVVNRYRPISTTEEQRAIRRKSYYENKEVEAKAHKAWQQRNKAYMQRKYQCSCGVIATWHQRHSHQKSKRHLKWAEETGSITMRFILDT